MRKLYSVIFYCLLPFILLRMLWRARKAPAYAARWSERFGFFPSRAGTCPAIWLHAVSVGETLAALPLIRSMQQRFPEYELVITTTTPTGSDRVTAALGDSVFHVYGPYDLPSSIARFLARTRPVIAIIMETELWPNLIHVCQSNNIPVVIANARLSQNSARGYARLGGLSRNMLQSINLIAAQSVDDSARFVGLGACPDQVKTTGNIKFDLTLHSDHLAQATGFRKRWDAAATRQVLLAASTHEGEDALLLQSLDLILEDYPQLLLVLVPRHPERFQAVAKLAAVNHKVQMHSGGELIDAGTQVVVGDTMGELLSLLGASDMVFMGGTWVENGGHNLIEPAAWGKPVFSGPSLFNFAEVSRLLLNDGAMCVVETPQQLAAKVSQLLANPQLMAEMGKSAKAVAEDNRGALSRLLTEVEAQLPAAPRPS